MTRIRDLYGTGARALSLVVLGAALAGCNPGAGADDEGDEETPAIPVEIALPVRGDINASYSGTAAIEAFRDATVIAKVGGEVREILVEEGDDVVAGQVLARLDGDRLRLEKDQAEARLKKLKRDYQRNLDLKEKGLISAGDFEKIQYEMEALQATYDMAQLEVDYTEIRAPIDGVVSERFIKVGNTIDMNAPTFQVTSLEPLVSYLHVPEREYRRLVAGQKVTIAIDALQGTSYEASVARVSPVVDPLTGTFKITIEVVDPSRRLKPGMFGRIRIVHDHRENVLLIPRGAVLQENEQSSVFVVDEGLASRREVETGYAEAGYVEVLSGVQDGDRVVIVGQANLKDGSKLAVINEPEAAATTNGAATNH